VLIDEIEQGLEPDRAKHLVKALQGQTHGQVFITTHSRDVLVELGAENIFLSKSGSDKLITFSKEFDGCIRQNPEAFFAKKIVVCEGATEVGIARAMNYFRVGQGLPNFSFLGVALADGTGSNFVHYCEKFNEAGFEVCAFCDSDDKDINDMKPSLLAQYIKIIDCDAGKAIEHQLFNDLPWLAVRRLINYAIEIKTEDSVKAVVKNQNNGTLAEDWNVRDTQEIRIALGKASSEKSWFKRQDHGGFLGSVWCDNLAEMEGKGLQKQYEDLNKWIDHV
jgi:hypothetical protein